MSTSIAELLPTIAALSHADKFHLVQLVLKQLAEEDSLKINQLSSSSPFDPRLFFGAAQQSKQVIDDYLANTREGWF